MSGLGGCQQKRPAAPGFGCSRKHAQAESRDRDGQYDQTNALVRLGQFEPLGCTLSHLHHVDAIPKQGIARSNA